MTIAQKHRHIYGQVANALLPEQILGVNNITLLNAVGVFATESI